MDNKISECYPWNPPSSLSWQRILCLDESLQISSHHSGEFLLFSLFLRCCQEKERRTVLIMTSHTASHYQTILKKNMINLEEQLQSGRLALIYLHSDDYRDDIDADIDLDRSFKHPSTDGIESLCLHYTWSDLMTWFRDGCHFPAAAVSSSNHAANPFTLLIDDIDLLVPLAGGDFHAARSFLYQLMQLQLQQRQQAHLDSLILYGRDTRPAASSPIISLVEYMKYHASIVLSISALQTGRHDAIHGILTRTIPQIWDRSLLTGGSNGGGNGRGSGGEERLMKWQYRALDTVIWITAVGEGRL